MRIIINNQSMVPIYEQLVNQLKDMIIREAAYQMGENEADLDVRAPGEVFSAKTGKSLSYYELSHTACSV